MLAVIVSLSSRSIVALVGTWLVATGGCNVVTRVGDLRFDGDTGAGSGAGSAGVGAAAGGAGSGGTGVVIDPPTTQWIKIIGNDQSEAAASVAIGPSDNVFVTGSLAGAVDFGGGALSGSDSEGRMFLASYRSDGTHRWSQLFEPAFNSGTTVVVSPQGDVVVSGNFYLTVDIGPQTLVGGGIYTGVDFLASFTNDGAYRWAYAVENTLRPRAAVGPAGEVVWAGRFAGVAELAGTPVSSPSGSGIGVVELTRDGVVSWVHAVDGAAAFGGADVAVDNSGAVAVAGSFTETVTIGNEALTSLGGVDGLLYRISPEGMPLWARTFGSVDLVVASRVAVGASGDIAVAGVFTGVADIGGKIMTSEGDRDIFVASYTPSGDVRWATALGDAEKNDVKALAVDAAGTVIASIQLGDSTDPVIHLVAFSENGQPVWNLTDVGPGASLQVAFDSGNALYAFGEFRGVADFGEGMVSSAGSSDMFLWKLQ